MTGRTTCSRIMPQSLSGVLERRTCMMCCRPATAARACVLCGRGSIGHMRSALLVVDVQNDVASDSTAREQVIDNIAALVESARSAGAEVVWVQHDDEDLPRGSWGWEI